MFATHSCGLSEGSAYLRTALVKEKKSLVVFVCQLALLQSLRQPRGQELSICRPKVVARMMRAWFSEMERRFSLKLSIAQVIHPEVRPTASLHWACRGS